MGELDTLAAMMDKRFLLGFLFFVSFPVTFPSILESVQQCIILLGFMTRGVSCFTLPVTAMSTATMHFYTIQQLQGTRQLE